MSTDSILYAASGIIKRGNSPSFLQVSGVILLDPTLRLWAGSTSTPADPAPPVLGNNQYSYFIPRYSLSLYTLEQPRVVYRFSGTAGCLYIERLDQDLGDRQWYLENGSGALNSCNGENFHWYNSDLSDYDVFNQLNVLPPFIRLTELQVPPGDPVLGQPVTSDVMLTKLEGVPLV